MQTRRQTQLKQREMEAVETLISMMQQSNSKSLPIKKRRVIAPSSNNKPHIVWSDDPPYHCKL